MFTDKLIEKIKEKNNPTVAGLDPRLEYIPDHITGRAFARYGETLEAAAAAITEFNCALIDALADVVPAVKPQLAYYEMYGASGLAAFAETCAYAREKGLIVIADGKRNDIGSTAEAYSSAYLGKTQVGSSLISPFEADALTVNPYLGSDGVKPFLKDCEQGGKGVFILVKTSNPSSGELQDKALSEGGSVSAAAALLVNDWGAGLLGKYGYSAVGAVVGATWPEEAERLRLLMPRAYILVPGYGAQGGTARDCARSFNPDGLGAIVNASRSIMCAYKSDRWQASFPPSDFAKAARVEAERMRDDINSALERI